MDLTGDQAVLLTVRGKLVPPNPEAARVLHNETAGSPAGIAAARGLSDLSHTVYLPATGAGEMSSATAGELLFIDVWADPTGLQQFFSNPRVGEQASKLFSARDATVWMPARGATSFHFPSPASRTNRFVGLLRVAVKSPEAAISAFRDYVRSGLADARRRGQMSHELYFRMGPPNDSSPPELLALDVWNDLPGMVEHYSKSMEAVGSAFAGKPDGSIWEQPRNAWSEW